MKSAFKSITAVLASIIMAGCSVIGQSNVETAPYTVLKSDESLKIEVRNYESLILVSTDMSGDSRNSAFRKLFNYISGENEGATEIAMTAPVIMDDKKDSRKEGTKIPMTAPVFMDENENVSTMSFVMPKDFTLETTPKPTNPDVRVSDLKNHKVATIQFSGTLSDNNVKTHTKILKEWISENDYTANGEPVKAGYNAPFTLPMMRRNEILIEVK